MNKKIKALILVLVLVVAISLAVVFGLILTKSKKDNSGTGEKLAIVPTMQDEISSDSAWCGAFQLIWNDLKNEIAGKDIDFGEKNQMLDNLNQESYTSDMISDEYYYKKYGKKSIELKEEIEKAIHEKFGQGSDILNNIDWNQNPNYDDEYFLYVMLYRKFEFRHAFEKLDNGKFGKYKDVEYFGIKGNEETLGNQINVLYYKSKNDFAIEIETKSNDVVMLCKNPQGDNFQTIYNNMINEATKYRGDRSFNEDYDKFKAPYINIDEIKEYKELENKEFGTSETGLAQGKTGTITNAIQTIKFKMDENGGEVKSEAGILSGITGSALGTFREPEPRIFYVDDTFALFLREEDNENPYFALKIEDITKFQESKEIT